MMFTNTGNLAFPLVNTAFGQDTNARHRNRVHRPAISTFNRIFANHMDSEAKIINPISAPTVLIAMAGIMVALTPMELNETILIPLDFLANTGVTLVLFTLGIP